MKTEYYLLAGVWILSLLLLIAIPRNRRRIAAAAFLFKQLITVFSGHAIVEFGMISYPVREIAAINRTSFTYEFLAYPAVCAVFTAFYPDRKPRWLQFLYYAAFCTALTLPEVLLEQYTDLIRYERWNWFWSWGTLFLTFMMTRIFCVVFFSTMKKTVDAD